MLEIVKTRKFKKSLKRIRHKKNILIELDNVLDILQFKKDMLIFMSFCVHNYCWPVHVVARTYPFLRDKIKGSIAGIVRLFYA